MFGTTPWVAVREMLIRFMNELAEATVVVSECRRALCLVIAGALATVGWIPLATRMASFAAPAAPKLVVFLTALLTVSDPDTKLVKVLVIARGIFALFATEALTRFDIALVSVPAEVTPAVSVRGAVRAIATETAVLTVRASVLVSALRNVGVVVAAADRVAKTTRLMPLKSIPVRIAMPVI